MRFLKSNLKRLIILLITVITSIVAIILGSVFYVKDNINKSLEYSGGAEYLLKIKKKGNNAFDANAIAESIYKRLNPSGLNSVSAEIEKNNNDVNIRIQYPDLTTSTEVENILDTLTKKPEFVLTDYYGNPLFNEDGKFNTKLTAGTDPKGFISGDSENPNSVQKFYSPYDIPVNPGDENENDNYVVPSKTPMGYGEVKILKQKDGKWNVSFQLGRQADIAEWTKAIDYASKLKNAGAVQNKGNISMWLNPSQFITSLREGDKAVNIDSYYDNNEKSFVSLAYTKNNDVDRKDFLLSSSKISKVPNSSTFSLSGSLGAEDAINLARNINYGVADFTLETLYSKKMPPTYGQTSFRNAWIAVIVAVSLIAIMLVVNYGLLGSLSVMSIFLYIFMTIFTFTIMRGEYSPASLAALILGIGMSVDASIVTFERLKSQMYAGASLKKSFNETNRKSLLTIFDSSFITMIVAIILFYLGTRSIMGLSIMLVISIIFTFIVMVLFTRITTTLLVNSAFVKNNKYLMGLKPKIDNKIQSKIDKHNYIKGSKWFIMGSGSFMIIGIVIFIVFAIINKSFVGGINLSQDFTGGVHIAISKETDFTQAQIDRTLSLLRQYGVSGSDVSIGSRLIEYSSQTSISSLQELNKSLTDVFSANDKALIASSNTSPEISRKLVTDAIIAISIAMPIIIIYMLFRFKWTFSIAAIVSLIHDALIIVFAFIIIRQKISPIFIAAILASLAYSINDTVVTFDRIREKVNTHIDKLDHEKIKELANSAIKETMKRTIWTSLTTVSALVILMSFGSATKLTFGMAMLFGVIAGTLSSIFIATAIWVKLETYRQNKIAHREKTMFWKTSGIEEQIVSGINEFKV